jgi:hypothetical protein
VNPIAVFTLGVAVAYLAPSLVALFFCALDGERDGVVACSALSGFFFAIGVAALVFGGAS